MLLRASCLIIIVLILTLNKNINSLMPIVALIQRSAKILILIKEGIIKRISYERHDYESVDEKSISLTKSRKLLSKKKIRVQMGY